MFLKIKFTLGLIVVLAMNNHFNIEDLRRILANCREYADNHHLGRPFMSAYQIAIRFAEEFPNHELVQTLPLGGSLVGHNQSLTQQIALFLSQTIRAGKAGRIEGGFISHDNIEEFTFRHRDEIVHVSTLDDPAHSIFRLIRATSDGPS